MSSSRKPFIIRNFDPKVETSFNCRGIIDSLSSFSQDKVLDETHAINAVHLSPLNNVSNTQLDAVDVINVKITTSLTDKDDLKQYRASVKEVALRWAEKCRLPRLRGWRASAVKVPGFRKNPRTGLYELRFEAIVGRRVSYDERFSDETQFDQAQVERDLQNLNKFMMNALNKQVNEFTFRHSRIGKGTILPIPAHIAHVNTVAGTAVI